MMESRYDLTNAALAAAERGWPVFPLQPGTKRPAMHGEQRCDRTGLCATGHAKWEDRATTDPALIRSWWRHGSFNVAIATGPAGLLVVDLDAPKNGTDMPDGMTTLKALCERAGQPLPATRTVRTAGGGWHLYFTAPAGVRLGNTAGTLGPLVDTRAWGGYVVAPGSGVRPGVYTLTDLADPAPLPAWLLTALTTERCRPPRPAGDPWQIRHRPGYAETALTNEARNVAHAPEGHRNQALTRAARALGRFVASGALPRERVEQALKEAGEAAGLTARECRATVTNALNWSIANNPHRAA